MGFNCNNKHGGGSSTRYVSVSNIQPEEWEKANAVLGPDSCGQVFPVSKPEQEMNCYDRGKLDGISVDDVAVVSARVDSIEYIQDTIRGTVTDMQVTMEAGFAAVNGTLAGLGERFIISEGDIALNASDVEALRCDMNRQGKELADIEVRVMALEKAIKSLLIQRISS